MRATDIHSSATVIHRRAPRARRASVLAGGGATALGLRHGRSRTVGLPKEGIGAEKNNSPVKEEIGDVRKGWRGASSGERRAGRRAGDERSGGDEFGTVKEKRSEEEVKETVPAPYLWGGFRSGFRFSRPRSPRSWVGSILCREPRGTIRSARSGHTEGHTAPTVRFRIGCGSPAREPKRHRACAEALECASAQTGRRVGPGSLSRIHREINGQDLLRWCYPVAGFASRLRPSR